MPTEYYDNKKNLKNTLLNTDWLEDKSKSELVDIILSLANDVYGHSTKQMPGKEMVADLEFEPPPEVEVIPFIQMPQNPIGDQMEKPLKLILMSSHVGSVPLGIEMVSLITIGRHDAGEKVDLDLTAYGAGKAGVSRRHAYLQFASGDLFLNDNDSTNGTYVDGEKVKRGHSIKVVDGNVLSFGLLHFKIKIVGK